MENNLERPSYYGIMTAEVRYDKRISASAKILFVEITALQNKAGVCWAGNGYFADLYEVQKSTVSEWVKQLEDAGYINSKVHKNRGNLRSIRLTHPLLENPKTSSGKPEPSNNKTNNSSNVDLEKSKSALLILVNEVTGRSFRTLPERGVKKTLDAFTLDEIRAALTALAADSWHKPKLKELSIDYFIRSTTIDKFKDIKPNPSAPVDPDDEDDDGMTMAERNKRLEERMG
jgi:hypothetical protein